MNDTINLIKGSKAKRFAQEKILKVLRLASVVSLGIVTLVSIVLFFLIAASPIESLRKEEKAAISEISVSQEKAGKLLFTKERVKDITDIVKKRTAFDGILTSITNIAPSGMQIDSLSLDKKFFLLTATSKSLSPINIFLEEMDDLSGNKKMFTKLTPEGLTVDPKTGTFIISITGNF